MLVSTIELFWRARKGKGLGLAGAENLRLDWKAMIERKDRIVESWSKGKEAGLSQTGVNVVRGRAKFLSSHEIAVDGNKIAGEKIIVGRDRSPHGRHYPGLSVASQATS